MKTFVVTVGVLLVGLSAYVFGQSGPTHLKDITFFPRHARHSRRHHVRPKDADHFRSWEGPNCLRPGVDQRRRSRPASPARHSGRPASGRRS